MRLDVIASKEQGVRDRFNQIRVLLICINYEAKNLEQKYCKRVGSQVITT